MKQIEVLFDWYLNLKKTVFCPQHFNNIERPNYLKLTRKQIGNFLT